MKRITVEEVQKAYEKTGLKPIQHDYISYDGIRLCGCPMAAVLMAEGVTRLQIENVSYQKLPGTSLGGFSILYEIGFTGAIDGQEMMDYEGIAKQGYEDGLKV